MKTLMSKNWILAIVLLLFGITMTKAQTSWQKYAGNPVLRGSITYGISGDFDETEALRPFMLEEKAGFRMWYVGVRGSMSVGESYSPDGVHWYVLRGNPELSPGPPGSFDAAGIMNVSVLRDATGYKMYYYSRANGANRIGMAYSSDGYSWTKNPGNPVLDVGTAGSWDDAGVWAPNVMFEYNTYKMWYSGYDGTYLSIGYAYSGDGVHWVKYGNNPVVRHGPPGSFDSHSAGEASVVNSQGRYHMVYTSYDGSRNKIGYAVSSDGARWTKFSGNPVLVPGPASWDGTGVGASAIIFRDNQFIMLYSGWGGNRAIGLATAPLNIRILQTDEFNTKTSDHRLILEAFPNPFNPSVTVRYRLHNPEMVTLSIFNTLGEEIAMLVNGGEPPGDHSIEWNAQNFSTGTYFCRLTIGGLSTTRKILLVK